MLLPNDLSEIEQGRRMIGLAQELVNEVFKAAMILAKTTLERPVSAAGIVAEAEVKFGKPGTTILVLRAKPGLLYDGNCH